MKPNIARLALITTPTPAEKSAANGCQNTKPRPITRSLGSPFRAHALRPTAAKLVAGVHPPELRSIILISEDARFHESLRCVANRHRQIIVLVAGAAGVDHVLQLLRPAAIMLDLDLPQDAAWNLGDKLLLDPKCPPVFLLTARTERFDVQTAVCSGAVMDKAADPVGLLQRVGEASGLVRTALAARKQSQRTLLRWLRPCNWSLPSCRFRGINE